MKSEKQLTKEATTRYLQVVDFVIDKGRYKTAKAFAPSINLDAGTISHLRNGHRVVTLNMILMLHEAHGDYINIDYVITGRGSISKEAPANEKEIIYRKLGEILKIKRV